MNHEWVCKKFWQIQKVTCNSLDNPFCFVKGITLAWRLRTLNKVLVISLKLKSWTQCLCLCLVIIKLIWVIFLGYILHTLASWNKQTTTGIRNLAPFVIIEYIELADIENQHYLFTNSVNCLFWDRVLSYNFKQESPTINRLLVEFGHKKTWQCQSSQLNVTVIGIKIGIRITFMSFYSL